MKTLYAIVLLGFLGLALIGCADNSSPIVSPTDKDVSLNSLGSLEKGRVLRSLTGSANTYNIMIDHPVLGPCIVPGPKQKGDFYNVQTIHAFEYSDGSFGGSLLSQFQGKIPKDQKFMFTGKVEVKVIQLLVDETGTKAKVVCEITKWNGPQLPWWFIEVFIDNGEGKYSPRDEMSSWWFSDQESDRDFFLSLTPQEYIDWSWE